MSYECTLNLCLVPNDDIDQNVQFDDFSFVYIIYIRMFSTIYFGTLLFNISNANIDPLNLIAINMNDSMFRNIRFIIIIWHINWLSKFIFSLSIYILNVNVNIYSIKFEYKNITDCLQYLMFGQKKYTKKIF